MKVDNVFCISLGPGDAELITVKARKTLQSMDVVFCPVTQVGENIQSRAKDILVELGFDATRIELFDVPMSKNRSKAQKEYSVVAQQIAQYADMGKQVAFVAEGDSGFYSSVHYVSDYLLEMGVSVQHIAGVPAFIACGALAGMHIVKQNEALLVIPSNTSIDEVSKALSENKTVVLMKLSMQKGIIQELINNNRDVQLHYFENVGVADKEYYTCNHEDILERTIPYFSILIIRKKD